MLRKKQNYLIRKILLLRKSKEYTETVLEFLEEFSKFEKLKIAIKSQLQDF